MTIASQIKTCAVEGCDKSGYAGKSRYCGAHRYRKLRHGDPLKLHPRTGQGETRAERFWSKVALTANPDKCWEWQGSFYTHEKRLYGAAFFRGRQRLAHRVAWEIYHGTAPNSDLLLLHSCDNPKCVNPNHLREGTHADNSADAKSRNRIPLGTDRPNAVLNADIVRQIRDMDRAGVRECDIIKTLGLPRHLVKNVRSGNTWRYVD